VFDIKDTRKESQVRGMPAKISRKKRSKTNQKNGNRDRLYPAHYVPFVGGSTCSACGVPFTFNGHEMILDAGAHEIDSYGQQLRFANEMRRMPGTSDSTLLVEIEYQHCTVEQYFYLEQKIRELGSQSTMKDWFASLQANAMRINPPRV